MKMFFCCFFFFLVPELSLVISHYFHISPQFIIGDVKIEKKIKRQNNQLHSLKGNAGLIINAHNITDLFKTNTMLQI